jgi:hypothetical protein
MVLILDEICTLISPIVGDNYWISLCLETLPFQFRLTQTISIEKFSVSVLRIYICG